MEKKVAIILVLVVMLGFWVSGLLFFTGNPFAQTTGTYHYNLDNVTVSIPTSLLDGLKFSSTGSGGIFAYNGSSNSTGNVYTTHNIYAHVSQMQIQVTGSNWDLFITRIGNMVTANAFLEPALQNWVSSFLTMRASGLLYNIAMLTDIIVLIIVGIACLSLYGSRMASSAKSLGGRIKKLALRGRL